MTGFSQWLNISMENKGVSGNELAHILGVDISQVSRWRNGHKVPTLAQIDDLARAFRVDALRLAVLSGRLSTHLAKVEPLPVPDPKRRVERIREVLEGIKGLTPEQVEEMINTYRRTL